MKKILTIILAITLCTACFAVDIEEVIASAYENSSQVSQYERSRSDSLLSSSVSDRTFSYSVSLNDTVYDKNGTYIPVPDLNLTYKDNEHDIEISGDIITPSFEIGEKNSLKYNGFFSISKTFNFNGWTSEDYTRKIRNIKNELSYKTSVLNFRKSVLADVYSIIDAQLSIEKAERSLEDSRSSYNTKLATGQLIEGSTTQMSEKMKIDSSISSLNSQKTALENKLKAFEKNYGIAYTEVDSATKPVLEFEADPEGNSEVYVAKLTLLGDRQALNEKVGKGSSMTISAGADPKVSFNSGSGYEKTTLDVNAGLKYKIGNLSVSGTVSSSIDNNTWSSPTVRVIGSYTGGNGTSNEVNKLESAVFSSELAYDTAVYKYRTNANTVLDNIQTALVAYDQLEIQKEYHNKILEYTKTLYENGFVTEKEYDSARFDVRTDQVQELLLNLKAMQLETEIQLLSL